jgi:branched-chain amino acid transport system substrate-binding protein
VAVLAGCGGTSSTPGPTSDYTGHTLPLGAVVSVTGPGAIYGVQQKNALQLAVETINKAGGVNGASISLDLQDDGSVQQQGVDAFVAQIHDKRVLGVIGPTLTNTAVKAHPEANNRKVPVIAASSTGAGIVGSCPYPCDFIFRDSLAEAVAIPDNVKAARDRFHPATALILSANDDKSSVDGASLFRQAFADNGVTIPDGGAATFSKNESNFTDIVTAALAKKADIWAVSTLPGTAVQLMAEARKQGYKGPMLGTDSFNYPAVAARVADAYQGAQSAAGYFGGSDNAATRSFVTAYAARFKDGDGKPLQPDEVAAQAYTAVLLFAEAAKKARLTFADVAADRVRLRDALAGVSVDSPLGPVGFTATHDVRQQVYIVAIDGKGGYSLLNTVPPQ